MVPMWFYFKCGVCDYVVFAVSLMAGPQLLSLRRHGNSVMHDRRKVAKVRQNNPATDPFLNDHNCAHSLDTSSEDSDDVSEVVNNGEDE